MFIKLPNKLRNVTALPFEVKKKQVLTTDQNVSFQSMKLGLFAERHMGCSTTVPYI